MKKLIVLQVVLALLAMTSCNNSQQKADEVTTEQSVCAVTSDSVAAFEAFKEHFGKSSAFAYTEMSGRQVLLVSQETYGNNENAELKAVEASIFALDEDGKIVALGSIRSQGTLYPVSVLDGKLMVAGHQFVRIYSIRGDVPELVLDSYGEGETEALKEMFDTFEKGTPILFDK